MTTGQLLLFLGTVIDNKIYGRGAIDDKGPTIASLYAMKYVMDNLQVKKRVRLILGLDEERNWESINYYKKVEKHPDISFSPDADFPCIYSEKSVLKSSLSLPYLHNSNYAFNIETFDCKNNPLNVVPNFCSCKLIINENIANIFDVLFSLNSIVEYLKYDITFNYYRNTIEIISNGTSSHAAHPDLGSNAISHLIKTLYLLCRDFNFILPFLQFYEQFISNDYSGKNLNINFSNFSGELTLNVGSIEYLNDTILFGIDLRIPATIGLSTIKQNFETSLSSFNGLFNVIKYLPSLHIQKDSYLVSTLCNIYNNATSSNKSPISIGGATYARAFNNSISFGPNLPGQKDMCHQADEFIDIDQLMFCSNIYADSIYELAKEDNI